MKQEAFVPQESGRGLNTFLVLEENSKYDLAEMGKVFIPAHLDDLVKCNVVCPLYHNAFKRK